MNAWINQAFPDSQFFMPHGHCYLWIPSLLWLHVSSDILIGTAYIGIALLLWALVRRLRLPFSPVFIAFGLFIALCGGTHFMEVWTAWDPHYWLAGWLKAATALASVATAIGLLVLRPRIQSFTEAARVSEERRVRLESTHAELATLYERLKRADEYKNDFFASVSHELRTPLALIVGPASRLRQSENLTEPQRRALQGIEDNATVLLRQVNDLLDLTKTEAKKMEPTYADIDLVPWTRRLVAQFDVAFDQHRLACALETPETLDAAVDADKLERVLINLLGNAIKFTPAGGSIAVKLAARDGTAVWSVADSGPGIPESQRSLIFERFHRGGAETRTSVGGTGLGLAIAKDFVALHGGRLSIVDGRLGGSEFIVEIPLRPPAGTVVMPEASRVDAQVALAGTLQSLKVHEDAAHRDPPPLPDDAPVVVVVEDNAEMRAFVRDVLGSRFRVTTAVDGVEGLATVRALRPDLVVSDLTMPRMDGERLVEAIRSDDALDHVPVLLLTARSDDALRVRLLQSGAQDYVGKPFLPDELLARAQNLISAKRAGDTLRETLSSLSGDLETLAHDIAVRNRQLSAALAATEVAREQAERASMVKGSFLGLVSHEIRTPLASILMNLELLGRDRAAPLAPSNLAKLERVTVAARKLQLMMEGLLEYVRFDRGGIEPTFDDVDVHGVIRDVVDEQRTMVEVATLSIEARTADAPCRIRTDRRLLAVLLGNLVGNAIKFTREGSITVEAGCADGSCAITVVDTGVGIPRDALGKIFLPFEQLEPLQRKSLPGVGLGLALVKQIVETLHGTIDVESTVGHGSTFRVRLPLAPAPQETHA